MTVIGFVTLGIEGGMLPLTGIVTSKTQLGRPRRGWESGIKMHVTKIGCSGGEVD